MTTAHDVAAYILAKSGAMSAMKLQKLCYYSQAWSLVWDEEPLFMERIEAWANGPVIPELYQAHRGMFTVQAWPEGDAAALTKDQRDTVEVIIDGYGKFTAQQLSELTHKEAPWRTARGNIPESQRSNAEISRESMADFYSSLAARTDTQAV